MFASVRCAALVVVGTAAMMPANGFGASTRPSHGDTFWYELTPPESTRVLVRAGSFQMGSDASEVAHALACCRTEPRADECKEEMFSTEYPRHEVVVSSFWIDRTEVTNERYRRCSDAGVCSEPPYLNGARRFDQATFPVVLVSLKSPSLLSSGRFQLPRNVFLLSLPSMT